MQKCRSKDKKRQDIDTKREQN